MILSQRDHQRLTGVHHDLVRIVERAAELSSVDFIVTEGVRTLQRQKELYAQGRTKPGKIVTQTMHSRHLTGHAVDLCPLQANGTIDWNDRRAFDAVYFAMTTAAKEFGIALRPGMDWDRDGTPREKGENDSPHYELNSAEYPA